MIILGWGTLTKYLNYSIWIVKIKENNYWGHLKLSRDLSDSIDAEKTYLKNTSYSFIIKILMFVMMSTKLEISHVIRVVS